MSLLSIANKALRAGNYSKAISSYAEILIKHPEFAKNILVNLKIAQKKYRESRMLAKRISVSVCGWDLGHNAAGRVYTLATLYKEFCDVVHK
jgi:lipopolysaccharide biosynthesis regulator YciM